MLSFAALRQSMIKTIRRYVYWAITFNCNFNCHFCGYHNRKRLEDISEDKLIKYFDFIKNYLLNKDETAKNSELEITGGEFTTYKHLDLLLRLLTEFNDNDNMFIVFGSNFSGNMEIYERILSEIKNPYLYFTWHQHHMELSTFLNKYTKILEYGKENNPNARFKIQYNIDKNSNDRYDIDYVYKAFKSVLGHNSNMSVNNIIYDNSGIVNSNKITAPTKVRDSNIRYQDNMRNTNYMKYTYCHRDTPFIHPNGILYRCFPAERKIPIADLNKRNAGTLYKLLCKKTILCDSKFCYTDAKFYSLADFGNNNEIQI